MPSEPITGISRLFYWLGLFLSLGLYLYSLTLPALHFGYHEPLYGVSVLAEGWLGVISLEFAWFANPAFWFAVFLYVRRKFVRSLAASGVAIVLCLLALGTKEWWFNEGVPSAVTDLGVGYYVWMTGIAVLLLIGGVFAILRESVGIVQRPK